MGAIGGSNAEWGGGEEPLLAFGRERRLHARAYAHWASLLRGRRMPALADLDPASLSDFAEQGVLVELTGVTPAPGIAFLGRALRDQAGIAPARPDPAEVPRPSLLAALLDRVPALAGANAPLGFEAELADGEDGTLLHRGILLPFAGEDGALGAVLGVISWKRVVAMTSPDIVAAVGSAFALRPAPPPAHAWGDGPGAAALAQDRPAPLALEQRLAAARTWAALVLSDRTHGAAPLHAALGAAYDVLIAARQSPQDFAALAEQVGVAARPRAMAVAALTFADTEAATRRRYAAVLAQADRLGIGAGQLADTLDRSRGGWSGFAAPRAAGAIAPPADPQIAPVDPDGAFLRGHRRAAAPAPRRNVA